MEDIPSSAFAKSLMGWVPTALAVSPVSLVGVRPGDAPGLLAMQAPTVPDFKEVMIAVVRLGRDGNCRRLTNYSARDRLCSMRSSKQRIEIRTANGKVFHVTDPSTKPLDPKLKEASRLLAY